MGPRYSPHGRRAVHVQPKGGPHGFRVVMWGWGSGLPQGATVPFGVFGVAFGIHLGLSQGLLGRDFG